MQFRHYVAGCMLTLWIVSMVVMIASCTEELEAYNASNATAVPLTTVTVAATSTSIPRTCEYCETVIAHIRYHCDKNHLAQQQKELNNDN